MKNVVISSSSFGGKYDCYELVPYPVAKSITFTAGEYGLFERWYKLAKLKLFLFFRFHVYLCTLNNGHTADLCFSRQELWTDSGELWNRDSK